MDITFPALESHENCDVDDDDDENNCECYYCGKRSCSDDVKELVFSDKMNTDSLFCRDCCEDLKIVGNRILTMSLWDDGSKICSRCEKRIFNDSHYFDCRKMMDRISCRSIRWKWMEIEYDGIFELDFNMKHSNEFIIVREEVSDLINCPRDLGDIILDYAAEKSFFDGDSLFVFFERSRRRALYY